MLFSNELNYWVIKKKCEKIFTAPDGGAISEPVSKYRNLDEKLNGYKICSKARKLPKGRNLWELLYFITNLLNDCNWFL
ncbi:hypothetical protein DQM68_10005 [Leptospira mayottensis]|nr:hypothetical protein DQM68_10005 [Leptospira mayottensis]AZQ02597.1 hypothetical protein LEP1GSC190_11680 [Leptospira mayottensis 200901116]